MPLVFLLPQSMCAMFLSEFFTLALHPAVLPNNFWRTQLPAEMINQLWDLSQASERAQIQGHCLDTSEAKTAPQ